MPAIKTSISRYFGSIPDRRIKNRSKHLMLDIFTIVLCAVMCGADTYNDIENFARKKRDWLGTFLELPGGIPTHDTINRVMSMIRPDEFLKCFSLWADSLVGKCKGVVALDGKTLRRSHDRASGKKALHMVSAFCAKSGVVLGQMRTYKKSNEIKVIPKLIEMLDLRGAIVTIDAMGCQKNIVKAILEAEADYTIALKGNQKGTMGYVELLFKDGEKHDYYGLPFSLDRTVEKNHGRLEIRDVVSIGVTPDMDIAKDWPGLKSVNMVKSTRELSGGEKTEQQRYYISSLGPDAERIGKAIRDHWSIENTLHWSLDVNFKEDQARNRKNYSSESMAFIRRMAINLMRKEATAKKGSLRQRRLEAAWDSSCIIEMIS